MEAADSLSLCWIHVGSYLLQPRLLMRGMKGPPLSPLQFPVSKKKCFSPLFNISRSVLRQPRLRSLIAVVLLLLLRQIGALEQRA